MKWVEFKETSWRSVFYSNRNFKHYFQVLNSTNLPPKLIATFDNGYVYSFVPGESVTLELYYKNNLLYLVPDVLARIHKLEFPSGKKKFAVQWDKSIQFIAAIPDENDDQFKEITKRYLLQISYMI